MEPRPIRHWAFSIDVPYMLQMGNTIFLLPLGVVNMTMWPTDPKRVCSHDIVVLAFSVTQFSILIMSMYQGGTVEYVCGFLMYNIVLY